MHWLRINVSIGSRPRDHRREWRNGKGETAPLSRTRPAGAGHQGRPFRARGRESLPFRRRGRRLRRCGAARSRGEPGRHRPRPRGCRNWFYHINRRLCRSDIQLRNGACFGRLRRRGGRVDMSRLAGSARGRQAGFVHCEPATGRRTAHHRTEREDRSATTHDNSICRRTGRLPASGGGVSRHRHAGCHCAEQVWRDPIRRRRGRRSVDLGERKGRLRPSPMQLGREQGHGLCLCRLRSGSRNLPRHRRRLAFGWLRWCIGGRRFPRRLAEAAQFRRFRDMLRIDLYGIHAGGQEQRCTCEHVDEARDSARIMFNLRDRRVAEEIGGRPGAGKARLEECAGFAREKGSKLHDCHGLAAGYGLGKAIGLVIGRDMLAREHQGGSSALLRAARAPPHRSCPPRRPA